MNFSMLGGVRGHVAVRRLRALVPEDARLRAAARDAAAAARHAARLLRLLPHRADRRAAGQRQARQRRGAD